MRVGIVNCVSEALEMLRFSSEQLITNAGTDQFDYIIVCWKATEEVNKYIEELTQKFAVSHPNMNVIRLDHRTNENVGYVPNLRLMMNEGFDLAFSRNDYAGLVNTDQAFYVDWLENLRKHCSPNNVITSTLIEPSRGTRHIEVDCGLTEYGKFNFTNFIATCHATHRHNEVWTEEQRGGFMNSQSLPYLFPKAMWEQCGPWELTLEKGTPDVNFFTRAHHAGFKYIMSRDSIAYHVGGAERGATKLVEKPKFSERMKYE